MMSALREVARGVRQSQVYDWCANAFGKSVAENKPERGARVLEEAIELAQATGVPEDTALKLVRHVYSRPVGKVAQEIGQVGITLLVLAELYRVNADHEEIREFERIKAKLEADPTHFAKRLDAKAEAGVGVRSDL